MKRFIYFAYFLYSANYSHVWQSVKAQSKNYSRLKLIFDCLRCSLMYSTSSIDYFNFRFFERSKVERKEYATMGYMYEFHKKMNKKEYIQEVDDKTKFRKNFADYAPKSMVIEGSVESDSTVLTDWLVANEINGVVVKQPDGTTGKNIYFFDWDESQRILTRNGNDYSVNQFLQTYSTNRRIYLEERLEQHPLLNELAPNGLNTIRMITVINNKGEAEIIGSVLRLSILDEIDNYSAGNIAAEIDMETGVVISPGVKKLAACYPVYENHPITNQRILGFKIPQWEAVKQKVLHAATVIPEVRTVGWDVAVLENDVRIIEGNSTWNKDTWQIPAGKGKKSIIQEYS